MPRTARAKTWREVAPRVKALVEKKYKTHREFADVIGVSEGAVSLWLSGDRTPRADTLFRIVAAAGGSFGELLGEEPMRGAGNPRGREAGAERAGTVASSPQLSSLERRVAALERRVEFRGRPPRLSEDSPARRRRVTQ